jgi:CxxC-x17-CxxC domain-containing protein
MSNYKRGNNFGGNNFKKPSFKGGSNFGNKEMFRAVCNTCEKNCEVPFRPNGKKPVLCSDCFQKDSSFEKRADSRSDSQRSGDRNFNRPSYQHSDRPSFTDKSPRPNQYKQDFEALNAKLDKILRIISPSAKKQEEKLIVEDELKEILSSVENITAKVKKTPKAKKTVSTV